MSVGKSFSLLSTVCITSVRCLTCVEIANAHVFVCLSCLSRLSIFCMLSYFNYSDVRSSLQQANQVRHHFVRKQKRTRSSKAENTLTVRTRRKQTPVMDQTTPFNRRPLNGV